MEVIHNPNNKTLNHTIINNMKNAREGGAFKKECYMLMRALLDALINIAIFISNKE
ncbi:hypothetical protein [Photobacterium kishitanii]|uniref:hypothetical protein n=1 Tax=Photobacterium kishitanii TaxID=318456 RepID=UPI001364ADAC|nr:hypothetical protein [Photobacterium kishitanii]